MERRLPASPESVAALRRAVVDLAVDGGLSERRCEDVALAVSEALSNVVVHAYDADGGDVRVDAWIDEAGLEVAVLDEGQGMVPRRPGTRLGLGLALMSQVSDELQLLSGGPSHGMRVRMRFARE